MNAEFHPNGYIETLIKLHGPNSEKVKEAIEFWGPDAGEFAVMQGSLASTDTPASSEAES